MAASPAPSEPAEPVERHILVDTLTYPLRGNGLLMIAIGSGFSILLSVASLAPILGIVAAALAGGFFASFYLDIINGTVNGSDDLPDWPDISNFMDDVVSPMLKVAGVWLISALPYLLTFFMDKKAPERATFALAGQGIAAFYFPMAMLGFVMHGHLGGAMPHRVLPAIFRTMPGYLVAVVLCAGLVAISSVAETVASNVPLVGFIITAAPSLYFLMAEARLIGLLYRSKREQIGWG